MADSPGGTSHTASATSAPKPPRADRIALLEPGDLIDIDIPGHSLKVRLSEEELARRAKQWKPRPPRYTTGC